MRYELADQFSGDLPFSARPGRRAQRPGAKNPEFRDQESAPESRF
jgi:hypothetical protein